MPFSSKPHVQLLADALVHYGVEHVIISPGSRNGALSMHFAHHPKIQSYSVVDERSAGFFALGMAQKLQKPVAVCCTSGSATVNYYPAVVEAFYQNIPLIIISADRPEHLVDQFDGQTIRQYGVFEKHLKFNIQLKESDEFLNQNQKLLNQAFHYQKNRPEPIHINVPISAPIYESCEDVSVRFLPEKEIETKFENIDFQTLTNQWDRAKKKMILVGMHQPNQELEDLLIELTKDSSVVILTETTSNLHHPHFFGQIDAFLFHPTTKEKEQLQPDLLLTIGQNVISKKVKQFLRENQPEHHWHLDENWQPNTFGCLTEELRINPIIFLRQFLTKIERKQESNYFKIWNNLRQEKRKLHHEFLAKTSFSDFKVFESIINQIPKETIVHFANSSPIRYAQLFDIQNINPVYGNRGTSGIDGSTGTAIGFSTKSIQPNLLITGDISFFYDSNSLWNNYTPKNFKIILINNGGGNIFKIIHGPDETGVLEEVFETRHSLTAQQLCKMFGYQYFYSNSMESLLNSMPKFFQSNHQQSLLEIDTRNVENAQILRNYFNYLSNIK